MTDKKSNQDELSCAAQIIEGTEESAVFLNCTDECGASGFSGDDYAVGDPCPECIGGFLVEA